jgi:hypothetical protein
MDHTTTLIVGGLGVLLILGAVYLLTRPAPKEDVSLEQVATLAATVAAYW